VGHLEVEARALDVDYRSNERRARAAGEVVEGEGLDRADLVGEAHALEVVAREAAEADALARVLHAAAAPATEPGEAHVVVAAARRSGANAVPALPTFPKSASCACAGSKPSSRTRAAWLRASGP